MHNKRFELKIFYDGWLKVHVSLWLLIFNVADGEIFNDNFVSSISASKGDPVECKF